jgi:hypothetical protein
MDKLDVTVLVSRVLQPRPWVLAIRCAAPQPHPLKRSVDRLTGVVLLDVAHRASFPQAIRALGEDLY